VDLISVSVSSTGEVKPFFLTPKSCQVFAEGPSKKTGAAELGDTCWPRLESG
jgi:hypothetical protein